MLTTSEIYYLNGALDGKEIYGINTIYNTIESLVEKKNPKKSLISKKVLNEDGKLNAKSIDLINILDKYKNADSYIWIDNKVVSKDKSINSVILDMKDTNNISLNEILKSAVVLWIFSNKTFLLGNKKVYTKYSKIVKVSDFYFDIFVNKSIDNFLCLREDNKGNMSFYTIYFVDKGDLFKYDYLSKTLSMINPKDAREEILSLFEIKG